MMEFTPLAAAVGGAMIGAAAGLLLLANRRVAGISGILAASIWPSAGEGRGWRLAFLLGLPAGAAVAAQLSAAPPVVLEAPPAMLALAGLLVGFGTRLGNGCTSGHGVCGLARGSARSLAATIAFMAAGVLTASVLRHGLGVGS